MVQTQEGIMSRTGRIALFAVAVAVGACADSVTHPAPRFGGRAANDIATDPGVSFTVTGFTYGVGAGGAIQEENIPPCQYALDTVTEIVWKKNVPVNYVSTRIVFIDHQYRLICNANTSPYEGGSISITGTSD